MTWTTDPGTPANVIGVGLIGGSIGMALRQRGWRVFGSDANDATLAKALDLGAIDEIGLEPSAAITFVATPVTVAATPAPVQAPITGTPIAKAAHPTPSVPQGKPAGTPPPLADWEIKIDQVLRANANETETAQMLINLLPTLPVEGQTEAAQHIANLIGAAPVT